MEVGVVHQMPLEKARGYTTGIKSTKNSIQKPLQAI